MSGQNCLVCPRARPWLLQREHLLVELIVLRYKHAAFAGSDGLGAVEGKCTKRAHRARALAVLD